MPDHRGDGRSEAYGYCDEHLAVWRRIAALSTAQGLGGGLYRGIAPGTSGRVWLASDKGFIERLDTKSGESGLLPWHQHEIAKQKFQSVLEDRRGRLWLGHSKGLARLDLSSHALKSWPAGAGKDAAPDNRIIALTPTFLPGDTIRDIPA